MGDKKSWSRFHDNAASAAESVVSGNAECPAPNDIWCLKHGRMAGQALVDLGIA